MILQLNLARAKSKDPVPLWDHPLWKLERKLNGWRFAMHFGRGLDRTYLTGRRVSDRTGVFSEKGLLVPQLQVQLPVEYTVLDGEVMPPPGCGFRDLATFMNSDVHQVQVALAKWGSPTYHAFDVLFADGQDVRDQPMLERRRLLTRVMADIRNPLIKLVEQYAPKKSYYETEVSVGGEGVVLKRIDATYGESGGWIKVKRVSTIDVIVTGFTDGKGKYSDQIGAVKVSVRSSSGELLEVAQVSGMTDEIRQHATHHPGEWLGGVIEIEAQEWGRDRLLHPRFVQRRPDADVAGCTFTKMMCDLGQDVEEKYVVAGTSREQTELKL